MANGNTPRDFLRQMAAVLEKHPQGLTELEIRREMGLPEDKNRRSDRRIRELRKWYRIDSARRGRDYIYIYRGKRKAPLAAGSVSLKKQAQVLQKAMGRCQMCGRTIAADGIKLHVDHRVPQSWGGTNELENLWAICSDCNQGKKDHFESFDPEVMKRVMASDSVHVRLGEALKAFEGSSVPDYLMEAVAGQRGWPRRTRELRSIGWDFTWSSKDGYRLTKWAEWPAGDVSAIIRAEERKRAKRGSKKSQ